MCPGVKPAAARPHQPRRGLGRGLYDLGCLLADARARQSGYRDNSKRFLIAKCGRVSAPHLHGGGPEKRRPIGVHFWNGCFIFCHVPENEATSENARVPLNGPARRRCGRSTRKLARLLDRAQTSRALIPSASPMLGAGQWERRKPKSSRRFSSPFRGVYLRLPALREESH